MDELKICCLFYADDLILLGDTEEELRNLFNCLTDWCKRNRLDINKTKPKVVHFRTPSQIRTGFTFKCCGQDTECTNQYKYLGLVLNEYLDFTVTAFVAQSATRSLGLLI